jgi:arylsulfatase A-like enzyme
MTKKPNIIVIKTDQQRHDTIGALGYKHMITPNIDKLVDESVTFSNAYCCGATCVSSRAAFYTGMFAQNTGVFHFDPWTHIRTWLHDLKDNGYHIAETGKVHHFPDDKVEGREMMAYDERYTAENFPMMCDWDDYSNYLKGEGQQSPCKVIGQNAKKGGRTGYMAFPLDEKYHVDNWIGRMSCRWIEDYDRDKPFFYHIGFVGPHDPFDPPQRFLDMYKDADVPAPKISGDEFETKPQQYKRFMDKQNDFLHDFDQGDGYGANCIKLNKMSVDDIKEMRRHYYAKVTQIDEQIGFIMDTLEKKGLLDNTIIVFTSDHGENLGDHQAIYKWLMTEQTTRIPMIIRMPGAKRGGTLDDKLFTQMDIGPTLLDFAGVNIPAYLDGHSNLQRTSEGDMSEAPDKVYCQDNYLTMVRTEKRRLVNYAGQPYGEYYDIENDPWEFNNLYDLPEYQDEIKQLKFEYLEWREISTYLGSGERVKRPPEFKRKWPAYHPHDPYVLQGAAKNKNKIT